MKQQVSKAGLIREIMANGYYGKSPNTLRRYSLEVLQGILDSLRADEVACTVVVSVDAGERDSFDLSEPITAEMTAYVDAMPMPAPVSVPSDRELYVLALRSEVKPSVVSPPAMSGLGRALASLLLPWTMLLRFAGIA